MTQWGHDSAHVYVSLLRGGVVPCTAPSPSPRYVDRCHTYTRSLRVQQGSVVRQSTWLQLGEVGCDTPAAAAAAASVCMRRDPVGRARCCGSWSCLSGVLLMCCGPSVALCMLAPAPAAARAANLYLYALVRLSWFS
jgi:hypothetical protein